MIFFSALEAQCCQFIFFFWMVLEEFQRRKAEATLIEEKDTKKINKNKSGKKRKDKSSKLKKEQQMEQTNSLGKGRTKTKRMNRKRER